jgi:hypothetical protein
MAFTLVGAKPRQTVSLEKISGPDPTICHPERSAAQSKDLLLLFAAMPLNPK